MRIATWNVNSIRARHDRIGAWLDRSGVDVLAIQELKCKDSQFPEELFTERGYEVSYHGLNQWNGVAIASRVGLADTEIGFEDIPAFGSEEPVVEARALSVTCNDVRIYSLYVPNGRELDHPHYAYKLDWFKALTADIAAQLSAEPEKKLVLCGDFNVAPLDEDVWDMAEFEGATHVSDAERAAMEQNRRLSSESQKKANDALFKGLEQQQRNLTADARQLERLQSASQGATGQMQAIGFANQLAANQANQLLQIRGLLIAQQNAATARMQAQADLEAQQQAAGATSRESRIERTASPRNWLELTR